MVEAWWFTPGWPLRVAVRDDELWLEVVVDVMSVASRVSRLNAVSVVSADTVPAVRWRGIDTTVLALKKTGYQDMHCRLTLSFNFGPEVGGWRRSKARCPF